MSLRIKLLLSGVIGGWGGFAAWSILDLALRFQSDNVMLEAALTGAIVGMCIGAFVSCLAGVVERRLLLFFRGLIVGSLFGLLGGVIGLVSAQAIYQVGLGAIQTGWLSELLRVPGWAIFGIGIGLMEGVQVLSIRRILMGGAGGMIGGVVGSFGFILTKQYSELQLTGRAVGFALLGICVGFFATLLPIIFRHAWVRVSSGREESQEFLLDKRVNSIGRSDFRDVRLADPNITPKHAEIKSERRQYFIYAQPGQTVFVNEQPVAQSVLADGAKLRIGNTRLTFRRKK